MGFAYNTKLIEHVIGYKLAHLSPPPLLRHGIQLSLQLLLFKLQWAIITKDCLMLLIRLTQSILMDLLDSRQFHPMKHLMEAGNALILTVPAGAKVSISQ